MIKYFLLFLLTFTTISSNFLNSYAVFKIDKLPEKSEIHVFIHVCTINHWKTVLENQLKRIKKSGLYKSCDTISLGILGMEDITSILKKYPKIQIIFSSTDLEQGERPTLYKLHNLCHCSSDNTFVLYMHSKEIYKFPPNQNITDWTNVMEYFVIDKWKDCIASLQDHDVCAVNWWTSLPTQTNFLVGNFWWARADYIRTLPKEIGNNSFDPDLWIGLNSPKVNIFMIKK